MKNEKSLRKDPKKKIFPPTRLFQPREEKKAALARLFPSAASFPKIHLRNHCVRTELSERSWLRRSGRKQKTTQECKHPHRHTHIHMQRQTNTNSALGSRPNASQSGGRVRATPAYTLHASHPPPLFRRRELRQAPLLPKRDVLLHRRFGIFFHPYLRLSDPAFFSLGEASFLRRSSY